MLAYAFETITAEQALNIGLGDTLTINGGPASRVSVVYRHFEPLKDGEVGPAVVPWIEVGFGGRTVNFGPGLTQLADVGAIVMGDGSRLFVGDIGDERVTAGDGGDGLYGGPGHDTLNGMAGDDFLHGNTGDDVLVGGDGADSLYGGQGNDTIYTSHDVQGRPGEPGDFAHGNLGDDEIVGGAGNDTLLGGQGNDFLGGRDGDDYLSGDLGDDELHGGMGNDTLVGGMGNDVLQGGFGADRLSGGDGDDSLIAQGPEGTIMDGGSGNDTIVAASAGQDRLWGGAGRDRFDIIAKRPPQQGQDDLIFDWESSDTLSFPEVSIFSAFGPASILPRDYSEFVAATYEEALRIAGEHMIAGSRWVAAQVGNDVVVFADLGSPDNGADAAVVLVGRTLADIDLSNFA